jgi:hypothetical protein
MSKFGEAFKAARKAGKKEFKFGGKTYTTKTKEEAKSKSPDVPKRRPDSKKKEPVKGLIKLRPGKKKEESKTLPDGRKSSKHKKYSGPKGTPNGDRAARKGYKTGGGF